MSEKKETEPHPTTAPNDWRMAPPGKTESEWDDFLQHSIVALRDWPNPLLDLATFPTTEQAFKAEVRKLPNHNTAAADFLWNFVRVMKEGDRVTLIVPKQVLAVGTVTGPYQFVDDGFKPRHRRTVQWDDYQPRKKPVVTDLDLKQRIDRYWPIHPLSPKEFAMVSETTIPDAVRSQKFTAIVPRDKIREQFASHGLHYTDSQIATFYTALQTKGFVILTGISGTGKTKIAQGLVDILPSPGQETRPTVTNEGIIAISVKPYMQRYNRVILPSRQVDLLPPMEVGGSTEVSIRLNGVENLGRLENRTHTTGHLLRILYFRGNVAKEVQALPLGQNLYLRPVLDDDGDAVHRIDLSPDVAELYEDGAAYEVTSGRNHLFLSVRPDWRDSTSLLGYFNPLTQTYEWTEFLRFILRAVDSFRADDGLAWFVILDEMNLAHVEYYFADLLSVVESGRDEDGLSREPLRTSYPDVLDEEVPPREVFLPPNLYIIGTVNMDETTHAFSPKVLDRAFTIELTHVNFSTYPEPPVSHVAELSDDERTRLLEAFTQQRRFAVVRKTDIREIVRQRPEIRAWLQSLNALLARDRFHFGYRVFDEIAQYLANAERNKMMPFVEAFDHAVFMKILPNFTGSRARLRSPLLSVLAWAIDPDVPNPEEVTARFDGRVLNPESDPDVLTEGCRFSEVARRALHMLDALEADGFVSFG